MFLRITTWGNQFWNQPGEAGGSGLEKDSIRADELLKLPFCPDFCVLSHPFGQSGHCHFTPRVLLEAVLQCPTRSRCVRASGLRSLSCTLLNSAGNFAVSDWDATKCHRWEEHGRTVSRQARFALLIATQEQNPSDSHFVLYCLGEQRLLMLPFWLQAN